MIESTKANVDRTNDSNNSGELVKLGRLSHVVSVLSSTARLFLWLGNSAMKLYAICLRMDRLTARSSWNLVSPMAANASLLFWCISRMLKWSSQGVRSSVLAVRWPRSCSEKNSDKTARFVTWVNVDWVELLTASAIRHSIETEMAECT